jgi:hypothetical protein
MRSKIGLVASVLCVSCVTNLQQHLAFDNASLLPDGVEAHVGELVRFEVRPPVAVGTRWFLECHGRTRFAAEPTSSALFWTAQSTPIVMETIQAPWDPAPGRDRASSRGWLWFGLLDHGENTAFDRELPNQRLPYRELAPVTFSSTFSSAPHQTPLTAHLYQGRVLVTYSTPTDFGLPRAPSVDAKLVETGGKNVLYAEVSTNFGDVPKQRLGYDVTLSYPVNAAGLVEVVLVSWVGHGTYYSAFNVDRFLVDPSKLVEQVPVHTPILQQGPTPNAANAPAG